MALTIKQQRVFAFIRGVIQATGEAPTMDQIQRNFQMTSPASVHKILLRLVEEGVITRTPNVSRGIELVEAAAERAAEVNCLHTECEEADSYDFKDQLADATDRTKGQRAHVDPEVLRAYDAYLKDWRWRMRTWLQVQNQYMPHRSTGTGDPL